MESKFKKSDSFYKVFHSRELSRVKDAIFPQKALRTVLYPYPLAASRLLLKIDNDVMVKTLSELCERASRDYFYVPFSKNTGVFPFVIGENRPFILLIPGGGYSQVCTLNEGFMMATQLNKKGYNAFVCRYRVGKHAHFPNPQDDVAECLNWILDNAKEFKIDTNGYAICGFSAGGHLASSFGTKSVGYANYGLSRPSAIILGYPVITMGKYTHKGSRDNLLQDKNDDPIFIKKYSVEKQVDGDYPPTFIWSCKNDSCVPYENTLMMEKVLKHYGVRCEKKEFEGKIHGLGVGIGTVADGWIDCAIAFWQRKT